MSTWNDCVTPEYSRQLRKHHLPSFTTQRGEVLRDVVQVYHLDGELSPQRDNLVVIFHALTGSADVALGLRNPIALVPNGVDLPESRSLPVPDWRAALPADASSTTSLIGGSPAPTTSGCCTRGAPASRRDRSAPS